MDISSYFKNGSWKKRDLSDQSNDGEDYKKTREGSLNDSFALNSMAFEDVITGSLQSPEWGKILIKYLQNVEQNMKKVIELVKTTQESQIKGKLHIDKLQESADFISTKFDENKKDKKQKEEKQKF